MSRRGDKRRGHQAAGAQFIPAFVRETRRTPAWKALSNGRARAVHDSQGVTTSVGFKNNNGHIYSFGAEGDGERGVSNRELIRRWYRELQHYGFIVMSEPWVASVSGARAKLRSGARPELQRPHIGRLKGKPTLDYKKWDGTPVQRQPNLARPRKNPRGNEKRIPDCETNVQGGRETNVQSCLGMRQRPPHPREVDAKPTSITIAKPTRTRNNVHI